MRIVGPGGSTGTPRMPAKKSLEVVLSVPCCENPSVSTRVSWISAAARSRLPGAAVKVSLARTCEPRRLWGLAAVRVSSSVSTAPRVLNASPRLTLPKNMPCTRSLPPASETLPLRSFARPSQVVLAPTWKRSPPSRSAGSLVTSDRTPPSASLPYSAELAPRTISTDRSMSGSIPICEMPSSRKSNCSDVCTPSICVSTRLPPVPRMLMPLSPKRVTSFSRWTPGSYLTRSDRSSSIRP